MAKGKRLIQHQNATLGIRLRMAEKSGDGFVVRMDPERALRIPKAVSGPTMVFKSLYVKSQIVLP